MKKKKKSKKMTLADLKKMRGGKRALCELGGIEFKGLESGDANGGSRLSGIKDTGGRGNLS